MFDLCSPVVVRFRLSEILIVGISGCRSPEVLKVGVSDCRGAEIRRFGSPISATKEKPYLLLYIKASEFQGSSVYYWNSLAEDLQYYIILHNKDCFDCTTHLVLSYKEHVQALVTFNPQNYHNMTSSCLSDSRVNLN